MELTDNLLMVYVLLIVCLFFMVIIYSVVVMRHMFRKLENSIAEIKDFQAVCARSYNQMFESSQLKIEKLEKEIENEDIPDLERIKRNI